jgi:hypothetical protein
MQRLAALELLELGPRTGKAVAPSIAATDILAEAVKV